MKKWIVLFCIYCFSNKLQAQGYGGPTLSIGGTQNGSTMLMSGGYGGWSYRGFFLGGGGYGLLNEPLLRGSDNNEYLLSKLGYGGVELGYDYVNKHRYGATGHFMLATGGFDANDTDYQLWVLEPKLHLFVQPTRFMRVALGYGYRWAFTESTSPINLSGHAMHVTFSFGGFH